jgi:hypothetical protein
MKTTNSKVVALVYQAGIANVFEIHSAPMILLEEHRTEKRLLQADFAACENFARGMERAGYTVYTLYCNMAGDIARENWSALLYDAPFREKFNPVGSFVNPMQD